MGARPGRRHSALAGTRSGGHLSENAAAVDLDLSGVLDGIETLTVQNN